MKEEKEVVWEGKGQGGEKRGGERVYGCKQEEEGDEQVIKEKVRMKTKWKGQRKAKMFNHSFKQRDETERWV